MFKKLKLLPLFAMLATALIGCAPAQGGQWFDYVKDGDVKLTHDYQGRDFFTDGIGQVKLKTSIDGDTAHFTQEGEREAIKSRFFGIDTPESTGKVQPYGKPASDFTKAKLKEADKNGTIVVSSPFEGYEKPKPDSTGERYVSLIWINTEKKNAPIDELYLLNLWIVQEGLSWVKNVLDMPQYSDTFYDAENQAKAFKKNMHSGEPDPSFPTGEYEVTSLLELKRDNVKTLTDPDYTSVYHNKKVAITGTVAGFSNHILYLQDYFDEEESGTKGGESAGINIFTGMSPVPSKYTTKNTYIQLFGLCQFTENFGFQITDCEGRFPTVSFDEHDTKVLIKASENLGDHELREFEYTPAELSTAVKTQDFTALNCSVKLTEPVEITKAYVKSINEVTLTLKDQDFGLFFTFGYAGDLDNPNSLWSKPEDFVGKKLLVNSGIYTYHKTMSGKIQFQINPNRSADVVWVK